MYVRWKRRQGPRGRALQWTALLVKSERVGGKPRQRVVGYLGSITENDMGAGSLGLAVRRIHFWARAAPRLVQLVLDGVLDADAARLVAQKLETVVPPYVGYDHG